MKTKPGTKDRSGAPIEIKPVSFRPGRGSRSLKSPIRLKWLLGAALAAVLILLGTAAWFVFTARQVVIRIEPQPEEIAIEGGIAAPKIGAYFLMRPGEYTLVATRQCFQILNKRIVIGDEKNQELKFSMTKIPGRLSLQVHRSDKPSVMVEGVQAIIDGQEVENRPGADLAVNPGRHKIEIRAEKYRTLHSEIDIEGCGIHQKFDYALVPAWSDITIDSIPTSATVLIKGTPAGNAPLTLELLEGDHEIELKAAGFKPWRTRLAVKANQPQMLGPVRLEPVDGTLTVQTIPSAANLMLSNTFAGQTPIKLSLPANSPHLIQLSKAGYETEKREVSVNSGASKTLSVEVKTQIGRHSSGSGPSRCRGCRGRKENGQSAAAVTSACHRAPVGNY